MLDLTRDYRPNGYMLSQSPEIIRELASFHSIDLTDTMLFYYEIHELQYDEDDAEWKPFEPHWPTRVGTPSVKTLEGYDVVTCHHSSRPECSLSCTTLPTKVETNEHCLLPSFERAEQLLNEGRFDKSEPGPFRIFAVYSVSWP
jgi:hypothetical protein